MTFRLQPCNKVVQVDLGTNRKSDLNIHMFSQQREYQAAIRKMEELGWVISFTAGQSEEAPETLFDIKHHDAIIKSKLTTAQLIELSSRLSCLTVYW
jgi:hypothetical protein